MTILATCATIAAALLSAQGGETINLAKGSVCSNVKIAKVYAKQVTVNAGGSTVKGLDITGGGVRWRSGRVEAAGGAFAVGPAGYGIRIAAAQRVTIDGVTVTNAKKGIVVMGDEAGKGIKARAIQIKSVRFEKVGEDAIIASQVTGFTVFAIRVEKTIGKPTECTVSATITFGLAQRDCTARSGAWKDGFHPDAVQMRDGVTDATISNNIIRGVTAGITQMDTTGDAPLARVLIAGNDIETDFYHRITLGECFDCRIEGNGVRPTPGTAKRAVIIAGRATRCGNIAPDDRVVDVPC